MRPGRPDSPPRNSSNSSSRPSRSLLRATEAVLHPRPLSRERERGEWLFSARVRSIQPRIGEHCQEGHEVAAQHELVEELRGVAQPPLALASELLHFLRPDLLIELRPEIGRASCR